MGRTSSGNNSAYTLANNQGGSETMQIQWSANVMGATPGFYQVKNSQWEEIAYDGSYIYRLRDTSPGNNQLYALFRGCPSNCALGSAWAPRTMQLGQSFTRNAQVKFYTKTSQGTCAKVADYAEQSTIVLQNWYSTLTLGNGQSVSDVIVLQSALSGGSWERYYYARGRGLVQFEASNGFRSYYSGSSGATLSREAVCTTQP